GETDEVLGADVGGEDGRPDDEPAQVAAGEKVIVGGVPVHPNRPPSESEQQAEVQQNDQPVPARHRAPSPRSGGESTPHARPVKKDLPPRRSLAILGSLRRPVIQRSGHGLGTAVASAAT